MSASSEGVVTRASGGLARIVPSFSPSAVRRSVSGSVSRAQPQASYELQQEDTRLQRESPSVTREIVSDPTNERPGTITVDNPILADGTIGLTYNGESCSAGGRYGCRNHGVAHNYTSAGKVGQSYFTFSFHGGLKEFKYQGSLWNPGSRRRIGQPYQPHAVKGHTF